MTIRKISILLLVIGTLTACEDVDQPLTNDYPETAFWKTQDEALAALTACYENMYRSDYFFGNEALSDNAYNKGNGFGNVSQISNGGYDGRTGRVAEEWSYHYWGINKCNLVLENADRAVTDANLLARIKAEARFIRAFHHFQLATWYGDVPLVNKVLTLAEAKVITRTPRAQVIQSVLEELEIAEADLPVVYSDATDRGRIIKAAAIALRARVNLYESNWEQVVQDCEKLINTTDNGVFTLVPRYEKIFTLDNEYNKEIIFDLQYGAARTYDAQRFFLPQSVGKLRSNLVPSESLVSDYVMINGKGIHDAGSDYDEENPYENRDPRFKKTIIHHGSKIYDLDGKLQEILTYPGSTPSLNTIENQVASPSGYYFRKYYDSTASNFNSGINLILIRYADVLLMYAEAKHELGQMNAAIWDKTIKLLRQRAGFDEPEALEFDVTLSSDDLRTVIRRERRTELAFEGLHIYDIRRWKTIESVLNEPVKGIRITTNQFPKDENGNILVDRRVFLPRHYFWPIPQYEIDQNKNLLPNNPGW
ncbi:RagB/SusD family nutrient uptake outer membrane protein [Pseudochryseolinea flava]|nr:RagB/SusD family nutrient uptake outer membrane protein [Pseudochryseolinea flava]